MLNLARKEAESLERLEKILQKHAKSAESREQLDRSMSKVRKVSNELMNARQIDFKIARKPVTI